MVVNVSSGRTARTEADTECGDANTCIGSRMKRPTAPSRQTTTSTTYAEPKRVSAQTTYNSSTENCIDSIIWSVPASTDIPTRSPDALTAGDARSVIGSPNSSVRGSNAPLRGKYGKNETRECSNFGGLGCRALRLHKCSGVPRRRSGVWSSGYSRLSEPQKFARSRYGSECGALAHHNRNGWY